jgi:type II secretory pathway pseudopilin PulG
VAALLIIGFVGAVLVLYVADRLVKARRQTRRLHRMSDRLDAATARADEKQEQRQAADQASAELTSFMPAIKQPPLTVPGGSSHGTAQPQVGRERPARARIRAPR